jgi:hypothetical protein
VGVVVSWRPPKAVRDDAKAQHRDDHRKVEWTRESVMHTPTASCIENARRPHPGECDHPDRDPNRNGDE